MSMAVRAPARGSTTRPITAGEHKVQWHCWLGHGESACVLVLFHCHVWQQCADSELEQVQQVRLRIQSDPHDSQDCTDLDSSQAYICVCPAGL